MAMSDRPPKFSVIIPTRDRPRQLVACLEAVARQDYPRDGFEVIVVDDASRSPLDDAVAPFCDRLELTLLRQPRSFGPGVGRNLGAKHAAGDFVAFTDDDCTPAPDWLQRLGVRFAATPDHLIGGRVINALTGNLYSSASHVILNVAYQYYDPEEGRAHFFPTSNFALSRAKFHEFKGFNEGWPLAAAEDREFCYRWLQRGFLMTHAPEANVYHHHRLTLASFCRMHFRYGRGAFHYHLLRAGGSGQGGLEPAWAFYWRCIKYPFTHMAAPRAIAVAGLLLLWQVSNAVGYFWQRSHHSPGREGPRLAGPPPIA